MPSEFTMIIDPFEKHYYKHEPEILSEFEISPLTEDYVENYPTVVERFFTRYYYIKSDDAAPYQVLFHSNRVCLICLAPEHPAFAEGIISLNFDIGNTDRSKNSVKGKGKKGAMPLQDDSTLALLTTAAGKTYKVPSCVRSKLLETNTSLIKNPKYLNNTPEGEGYLAILLPKPEHCDEIKESLLTQAQYDEYLSNTNNEIQNTVEITD